MYSFIQCVQSAYTSFTDSIEVDEEILVFRCKNSGFKLL